MMLKAVVKGRLRLIVREWKDGSGRIVSDKYISNLQTNHSLNTICQWLAGAQNTGPYAPPSKIQLGTGSPPPGKSGVSVNDTALWSPVAGTLLACDQISVVRAVYAQYLVNYQPGTLNDTYTEMGLLDADNYLWAHVQVNISVSSTQSLTVQWQVYLEAGTSDTATMTNYALQTIVLWLTGISNVIQTTLPGPTTMLLGTGNGVLTGSETALFTPDPSTLSNCDYAYTDGASGAVSFSKTWMSGTLGPYSELGLQDANGNLWAHALVNINNPSNLLVSEQFNVQLSAA